MEVTNNLRYYFPMIKTREEVLGEIRQRKLCNDMFDGWKAEQQEEFLDICTGARGVKITYDAFFKEIFNPEYGVEALEGLLSCILGRKVKILQILPNDSTRIADENSLLITDIVVELEDGSIANVEIQKVGYQFPGQRAACYSADLLLRQYKRVRDSKNKRFKYSDVEDVYTIIFFEKSPHEFYNSSEQYIHYAEAKCNSGVPIELLQKFVFVNLDIFKQLHHNKTINDISAAWLTFLSTDDPDKIIELINAYPEFKPLYENMYRMCQNVEDVMGLFSKELQMMDANTARYMVDEMQNAIEERNKMLEEKDMTIEEKNKTIEEKDKTIEEQNRIIEELKKQLKEN